MSELTSPVYLVRALTADGLRLDGLWEPAVPTNGSPAAVICLHGAGGNFYGGDMFPRLAPALVKQGYSVLRVNTRGRDGYFATRTSAGPTRMGSAYERVADCGLDIAAWVEWLVARGVARCVLLGHSLGAIKAVYSQAHEPLAAVAGVLAISPPRLSASAFRAGAHAEYGPLLSQARRLVEGGQPRTVLESSFPLPMLITAEAFLDKYGGETYNVVELVGRVPAPLSFIFGQRELELGGVAFAGLPQALRERRGADQHLDVEIVPDADHFYTGCHEGLEAAVLRLLPC